LYRSRSVASLIELTVVYTISTVPTPFIRCKILAADAAMITARNRLIILKDFIGIQCRSKSTGIDPGFIGVRTDDTHSLFVCHRADYKIIDWQHHSGSLIDHHIILRI
jgi:hypothetical protein